MPFLRCRFSIALLALALAAPARAVVPSATSSSGPYTCNGATTAFAVGFPFLDKTHLQVVRSTGATLVLTNDYTVSTPGATGTVTLTAGSKCPDGTLTIKRVVPLTQATPFSTQGSFNPKAHELAFDRLTMGVQQVARDHATDKAATDAAIVAAINPTPTTVNGAAAVLASGTTTPRTLAARFADVLNVLDFDLKCDGTTDDRAALATLISTLSTTRATLVVPGLCYVGSNITIPATLPVRFDGPGSFVGTGVVSYTPWVTQPEPVSRALGGLDGHSYGATFYAHPTQGSGSTCSLATPCTLAGAVSQIATTVAGGLPAGGVVVYLRGGAYFQSAVTTLTSAHSGDATHPVVFASYPGETARLVGGVPVKTWELVAASDGFFSHIPAANLPYLRKGAVDVTSMGDERVDWNNSVAELFCDGKPMQRGRWPDAPSYPAAHPAENLGTKSTNTTTTVTSLAALPSTAAGWATAAAYVATINRPFLWSTYLSYRDNWARASDVTGDVITVEAQKYTMAADAGSAPGASTARKWFVTNLLEEVDRPGEYWIDRSVTTAAGVYLYPLNPATLRDSECVVSRFTGPLLALDKTSHDITIDGLVVEASQRHGVYLGGTRNAFKRGIVRNTGAVGVWGTGSSNTIDHNTFRDNGLSAIFLGGWEANGAVWNSSSYPDNGWNGTDRDSTQFTISNNDIGYTNRLGFFEVGAIQVLGTSHTIRQNRIHHTPSRAIMSLNGTGTLVELNDFDSAQTFSDDSGTIYVSAQGDTNWASNWTIRYNYFHDTSAPRYPWNYPGTWGGAGGRSAVYFDDDGADHLNATGNAVYGNIVVRYGDGRADPLFDSCGLDVNHANRCGIAFEMKSGSNTISNNLVAYSDVAYVQAAGPPATPAQTQLSYNQIWSTAPYSLTALQSFGTSTVRADPGFLSYPTNLANRSDGTLVVPSDGSGVTETIPWSQIGIH